MNMNKYNPLRVGCYFKMPREIILKKAVISMRSTDNILRVTLLYLQDPRDDSISHFAWIKNLLRLVRSQITEKKTKKYFCDGQVQYNKKSSSKAGPVIPLYFTPSTVTKSFVSTSKYLSPSIVPFSLRYTL
ncbi:hypothetical protein ALC56_01228 [Trachymyrmex septentrionalis]|uniref:Uncharacterized protein n=1 Tax=Trachymyrmex septentrionalis TaxID=34720 RepID=A0A151K0S1_9HYME|nr:hypothetical protein ALC56_01228 [Trachymyrmex septentrionalis]